VNSMTAKDNSWAAATEAKLNATYARYIQRTGDQPRALVSELAPRPATADLGLFNPQQRTSSAWRGTSEKCQQAT
jgi:hypothetical protein